jgi:hypothetical protein
MKVFQTILDRILTAPGETPFARLLREVPIEVEEVFPNIRIGKAPRRFALETPHRGRVSS